MSGSREVNPLVAFKNKKRRLAKAAQDDKQKKQEAVCLSKRLSRNATRSEQERKYRIAQHLDKQSCNTTRQQYRLFHEDPRKLQLEEAWANAKPGSHMARLRQVAKLVF